MIPTLVALLLFCALVAALWRIRWYRREARELRQAVISRQPILQEEIPAGLSQPWKELCEAVNDFIAQVNRLQQQRAGELAQLEATLGSLREAVVIVDSDNSILLANSYFHELFPNAGNVLGRRIELVLRSSGLLTYVDAVRKAGTQPKQEVEITEGGKITWVEITGTLVPSLNGRRTPSALFVLHDITRQKHLELMRKEFVANVSHELRTPLSVIKGYVETLVDGHAEMPVSDRDKFLRTIQRHTDRLNSLLADLLTLSRLESANPGLVSEPVALPSFIVSLLEEVRGRPEAAGHRWSTSLDPAVGTVVADPLKLSQVFANLLENALKYTPAGSHIEVRTRLTGTEVEVAVADNGPGIPAADLPHIFERFYRVEKGRSREKGGTGLGLSIVKHIVQLHGGRVRAESEQGRGTTFFFTLPRPPGG
jgi:two-component system, OmpR family, phosphate regulon sensor histidine kinase PhoR